MEILISGDLLLWIEVYAGLCFLGSVAAWIAFNRLPAATIALLAVVTVVACAAFRPPEYNSDTWNYYAYVNTLSYMNFREAAFLTKLEPVHSALMVIASNFRIWLILECLIQIVGLYFCFRFRKNDHSFIILCAFSLTLSTSAMRYAIALVYFYYLICASRNRVANAVGMTAILSCLHSSMALSGAIFLRRLAIPVVVSVACLAILYERSLLGSRLEVDLTDPSHGIKVLVTIATTIIYMAARNIRAAGRYYIAFSMSMFLLFLVAALILPTFNRFVIMGILVLLANEWEYFRRNPNDIWDRMFTGVLAAMIAGPYLLVLPTIYFNGVW